MNTKRTLEAVILGAFLCIGLIILGYLLSSGAVKIKGMDRTVTVKGLAEREVSANVAIWPIKFNEVNNDLNRLYSEIQKKSELIVDFLKKNGFPDNEISISQPAILDRQAQSYGDTSKIKFRFTATTTITVCTEKTSNVMEAMKKVVELGRYGIVISGQDYQNKSEFLFTDLNRIKPEMIEEATKNAREVAIKFAKDSNSKLGKIKKARQGQFSIRNRDSSTHHIKKVRVVSTIEYFLSD